MFLGIDLGTSELKLLLLDERHRVVAHIGEALTLQRLQPLWSEQDPAEWWAALERAFGRLQATHAEALATVRAIGLSGQMHGAVVLGEHHAVLRPAILWNDGRSAAQCAALEAAVPELHTIAANQAMPGFTAPKLLWLREHEPDIFAQVQQVLLPKDWLRLQLTGELVSDMSDASGTLWLDVARRAWSPRLLQACGLGLQHMPRLVEGAEPGGHLRGGLAQRWGMRPGTLVAGGAGDNAASAVGMGAVRPGEGFVSLGTSGVVFLTTDSLRPRPQRAVHAFCHALPQRWHQMSVMLSAAASLQWVTHLVGLSDVGQLMARVAELSPAQCARAPLFLPYLSGERTPHNNPNARGVFYGLDSGHDAAALGYAVIEGVGFGLREGWACLDAPASALPTLSLVGGGARSSLWAQLLASCLGVRLQTHGGAEAGGALGAARLAWLADGGALAAVCQPPPLADAFEPLAHQVSLLEPRFQRFQRLYSALAPSFEPTPEPD